jgi:hypothetical protein
MTTRSEFLQNIFREFEKEHNFTPTGTKAVAEWAVEKGKVALPQIDQYAALAQEISRALREETATDKYGRKHRVNHAVRETKNGEQQSLWGRMGKASRSHMEKSFSQRREAIVSDCYHLKIDVDAYNDANPGEEAIQLELDFTDDVAEREVHLHTDDEAA